MTQIPRSLRLAVIALMVCSVPVSAQAPKEKAVDADPDPAGRSTIAALFASPAFAPVREAERIDALPVETIGVGLASTARVVEQPVALDAAAVRSVRARVVQPVAYSTGRMACLFEPGLALRFHKGQQRAQMLICFTCREVLFEDGAGNAIGERMPFDEDVLRLLPLARRAFPDRRVFQER